MYKSGNEIEKKLKQAKYVYNQILKFKGRIFVKGGIDEETGSYPLLTNISSFLAHSRSVFQYAHKEAKQSGLLSHYDDFVRKSEIVGFFKAVRNGDIHEYTISTKYIIRGNSPVESYDTETRTATGRELRMYVEQLSDLDFPKGKNDDLEITVTLGKRIKVDDSFIQELEEKGKTKLAEAARNGEELFEEQECDGEKDIFKLCDAYLNEMEKFIDFGRSNGFIS